MKYDVAIVGGGLVGCSAALHLASRKAAIVLLERSTCGSQASGVNYGGVRQQGRHPAQLPLSNRSRDLWMALPELVGDDCELVFTGHLKLARSEPELKELEDSARAAAEHGLHLELLSRKSLRAEYPELGDKVTGGSLCRTDGQANPRLVAPAFARAARKAGAEILENCEVRTACRSGDGFAIELSNGRCIEASILVNAAGAWGATIASWFDEHLPEETMAPNMCVTEPIPYFLKVNLGLVGAGVYVRQIPRGNVIYGGGHGVADMENLRAYPSMTAAAKATQYALELVPRLATAHLIRTWTGLEGRMPDCQPVLGLSATTSGLYHAFGFSGHGFQLGPGVGAVLSDLALDGSTPTPIEAFRADRFDQSLVHSYV